MSAPAPAPEPDLGRLLGLSGPGAWALAGLFMATHLVIAALSGGPPLESPAGVASLVLILATAVVLVLPWPTPLPLPLTLAVLGVVGFSTAAMTWALPTEGWPGWMSWHFGADNFLLFMVALRGRIVAAAAGTALMSGIAMLWSTIEGDGPGHGFLLTYWQVASFLAGAFFALWLRRTARRIAEFQETERRRIAAEQALEAGADERRRQLERVREVAGAALESIAAGTATDADRREHRLLEAELRDQIRGRSLARAPLPAAVRAARARGLEVVVLDDVRDETAGVPAREDHLRAAVAWAAGRVDAVGAGEVTIRLARVDGILVVTVASAAGAESLSLGEPAGDRRAAPDRRG